jgi:hypothetical protein
MIRPFLADIPVLYTKADMMPKTEETPLDVKALETGARGEI